MNQPTARITTPSVIALAQALHDDDRAPDMPQALAAARYVLAVHARELADIVRAERDGVNQPEDVIRLYADALEAAPAAARPDSLADDLLAEMTARCPEHGSRTETWPECRCAAARQAASDLAAARPDDTTGA